ncbi:MAG: hypothetical protein ACKVS9_00615 [Phycisphaerae bacterium]
MPLADSLRTALSESHRWTERPTIDALKPLPNAPAVYLLVAADDAPVQLGTTQQLRRLVSSRLIVESDVPTLRADLGEIVRGVLYRPVSNSFEATWWYYRIARELHPREYRKMIGFGAAWFLHVSFDERLPEIRVTDQIWRSPGEFVGPFGPQRAAHQALETLWDLFDLCRHPEQYRKSPSGSRCAYADMGRCDAPCDGAAAPQAMIERTRAAWRLATGGGAEWLVEAAARMKQLAAALQFERAAQAKQQIDAVKNWQSVIAPRVLADRDMRFVVALPATRRAAWKFLHFSLGELVDGPLIATRKLATELTVWLASVLAAAPNVLGDASPAFVAANAVPTNLPPALDPVMRMEQTWLVARLLDPTDKPRAVIGRVRVESTSAMLSESLIAAIDEFRAIDDPPEAEWHESAGSRNEQTERDAQASDRSRSEPQTDPRP